MASEIVLESAVGTQRMGSQGAPWELCRFPLFPHQKPQQILPGQQLKLLVPRGARSPTPALGGKQDPLPPQWGLGSSSCQHRAKARNYFGGPDYLPLPSLAKLHPDNLGLTKHPLTPLEITQHQRPLQVEKCSPNGNVSKIIWVQKFEACSGQEKSCRCCSWLFCGRVDPARCWTLKPSHRKTLSVNNLGKGNWGMQKGYHPCSILLF